MHKTNDLKNMRLNYEQGQLLESNIDLNPFNQFKKWFDQAVEAKTIEPNAMTLATATKDGIPSARIVLLKEFDETGFVFFTNYDSRKGKELNDNPFAAILFWWREFERQVRIEGKIEKISRKESEEYFNQRPLKSRYGALVSNQSQIVENREALEKRFSELEKQFGEKPPTPENWGGYRLIPVKFEFWQGRESRLHDRICYQRENNNWKIFRLQP
ncbi:MAG TPA: pyridoxamine 5'-phosphate oxidase [Ignavibacteriaceae bacterium]|jgi:pyridoxamine 5'-phosphate oxidase|nr:MAG: Pyridoxine/pyridoxamine 5'-phosphate oxidase [Ignavibacteria bacterium ADurb.Bin266]OQY70956.1 MAG: pyridoxamine 5'-phosphate oxidase [Ignavibacteriales bacterium UTCHB2]HQF42131.1 pyridoxamine 5'-phosphate oxidase [Ignavibacteriaceae bacterium]HQI40812.1 pyridoxamine 5'-phosphate oxidase [Ignavibacteriaceae bacterium]